MEKTIGQRLKELLLRYNMTNRDFSELVTVKEKQVSNWINGVSDIKPKGFFEIKEVFPDLNLHWLLTGEGEMFLAPENDPNIVQDNLSYYQKKCVNCEGLKAQVDLLTKLLRSKDQENRDLYIKLKGKNK